MNHEAIVKSDQEESQTREKRDSVEKSIAFKADHRERRFGVASPHVQSMTELTGHLTCH